ncbi:MAG: hypothetical protein WC441_04755 [Patescibacteria group bacterium]
MKSKIVCGCAAGFKAGRVRTAELESKVRGFCERFVSSAKAANKNGKVKITDLVGEAESILKMMDEKTETKNE